MNLNSVMVWHVIFLWITINENYMEISISMIGCVRN